MFALAGFQKKWASPTSRKCPLGPIAVSLFGGRFPRRVNGLEIISRKGGYMRAMKVWFLLVLVVGVLASFG